MTIRSRVGAVLCCLASLTAQVDLPVGMTAEVAASIERGVGHLVRTQAADGSWRADHGYHPVAMTSLAGLALLCNGSTSTRGRHWREVRSAVDFLLRAARPDGLITTGDDGSHTMFGHGFATLFLSQVYGMEGDEKRQQRIHAVLTRAVTLICNSQSGAGGWYYQPDSGTDEGSVTITQIQALRGCRNAGILVPAATIRRAIQYIEKSQDRDGGVRYRASDRGPGRPAITAAAVAVLYNAGAYESEHAEAALTFARRTLQTETDTTVHHYYAQFYLAQAMYQRATTHERELEWQQHYGRLVSWLQREQRRDGSWQGDGVGQTYGTALALVMLQLPSSLLPIYQR